jgi:hypothetical protein
MARRCRRRAPPFQAGRACAFAIGANKTYFCRPSHRDVYRAAAAAALEHHDPELWTSPWWSTICRRFKDRIAGSACGGAAFSAGRPALRWAWRTGRTVRRGLMRREDLWRVAGSSRPGRILGGDGEFRSGLL